MKESHVDLSWYGHCESNAQRKLISHETNAWFQKKKLGWNGLKCEIPSKTKYKGAYTYYVAAIGAAIVIHFFICLFNSISSRQTMTKWLRNTILEESVYTYDSIRHSISESETKLLRPTSPKPWQNFVEQMLLIKSNHIFPITACLRNDTSHPMVGMASEWTPGRTCGTKDLHDTSMVVYRLYIHSKELFTAYVNISICFVYDMNMDMNDTFISCAQPCMRPIYAYTT